MTTTSGRIVKIVRLGTLAISALVLAAAPSAASAQDVAPFDQGKTIRMVVGAGISGGCAECGR